MTLEQVAARAGLTRNYIGEIENGNRDPRLTTIIKLAKALQQEPGAFFAHDGISSEGHEFGRLIEVVPHPVRDPVEALVRLLTPKSRGRGHGQGQSNN